MTSVFLWCDAAACDGRSGQLGDARLVLPDGDPAVDEGGVGQNDAQVEASVGELLEPLRPVEGRLVEVEGRHGVREAEGELDCFKLPKWNVFSLKSERGLLAPPSGFIPRKVLASKLGGGLNQRSP